MCFKSEKVYKIIVFINMKFCLLYDFRKLTLKFNVKTNLTKIKHNSWYIINQYFSCSIALNQTQIYRKLI